MAYGDPLPCPVCHAWHYPHCSPQVRQIIVPPLGDWAENDPEAEWVHDDCENTP